MIFAQNEYIIIIGKIFVFFRRRLFRCRRLSCKILFYGGLQYE
ncbi:hypothetical protein CLOSTASPAR_05440 [[Clostridium] asparagiforme DSM 15981]|uniref:Uncharacterized protein n=1 Tax=[Clostridium] asparagiforme DSM 15981 TaxID=518636 RepID=C0D842_9FIRM|nr:hypothetical protein CLOSTASPAR_05440 [[Clostridium] asparagiforme DSM 15981]